MSLKLYLHPLSSFCQKALIAFYENDTPFEPIIVNLGEEKSRADFLKIWPVGKFPVLRDEARIERSPTDHHHRISGPALSRLTKLIPADADLARQTRSTIASIIIYTPPCRRSSATARPAAARIPSESSRRRRHRDRLRDDRPDRHKTTGAKTWAMGDAFTMADRPRRAVLRQPGDAFGDTHKNAAAYFGRLMERPCRAGGQQAKPYFSMFLSRRVGPDLAWTSSAVLAGGVRWPLNFNHLAF
jgi:glutathione S-transferase